MTEKKTLYPLFFLLCPTIPLAFLWGFFSFFLHSNLGQSRTESHLWAQREDFFFVVLNM